MIRRPPRSTLSSSSAASDVYKRQVCIMGPADRYALVALVLLVEAMGFSVDLLQQLSYCVAAAGSEDQLGQVSGPAAQIRTSPPEFVVGETERLPPSGAGVRRGGDPRHRDCSA